jgi:hypothetical protein
METFAANAGPVREVVLHGREWLVAPLTLIVPGVLNGSNGPLLYPREEVARDPQAWNGMPLVVYHPTDKLGNNVSGRRRGRRTAGRRGRWPPSTRSRAPQPRCPPAP